MAENIRQGFYGDEDRLEAANPYGCNQYGEGWKMPHNGKKSEQGNAVKKESNNKWDSVALDESYVDYYSPKAYIVRTTRNDKGIFVPAKLCKFDGEKCVISIPPDSDLSDKLKKFADETEDTHKAVDLDDKVRESIWKHINDREEAGEDFDGFDEFDLIYDAHREEREEKYWKANRKALDDGASYSEASSRARKARQKADEDFLRDFAENLQAASAEDCEEVEAFNQWGCNGSGHKLGCRKAKGSRESKEKNQPKLFKVDSDADLHTQIVQLTEAIEKAEKDGVRLEAVITRPEFGELTLQCGNSGDAHPNGVKHVFEERHNISANTLAELLLTGKVKQSTKDKTKLIVKTDSYYAILSKKEKKESGKTSKQKVKIITATKGTIKE